MTPIQFYNTIKDAYGCEIPAYGCLLVDEIGDRFFYDCWLIDWDIKICVPLPFNALIASLCFFNKQPEDYKTLKIQVATLFAYALAKFDKHPQDVQKHLRGRFGPLLPTMRQYAEERWHKIETIPTPTSGSDG